MKRIDALLAYWFTTEPDQEKVVARQDKLWWGQDPVLDAELRDRFGLDVERALRFEMGGWAGTARGRLALILLLDQVTRSIYRGTPKAFAGDATALGLCQDGLARGHDRELRPVERLFFYLPLMHAEDPDAQDRSMACFQELVGDVEGGLRLWLVKSLAAAESHRATILLFGRFPHRNEVLGRASTPEELTFLTQPGSSP